MSILALIEQGLSEEEALDLAVEELGMVRSYAEFVLAMERGEVDGDVVVLDEEQEGQDEEH